VPGQKDLFVVETQSQGRRSANRGWDVLMMNARRQAEEYAKALPQSHGWPPFILVCDVGHCVEVYADFSGQGKNYAQFPDRQGFRIYLEDLRKQEIRDQLKAIWIDPQTLDPSRRSAKVTREIAARLAQVSRALESKGHDAEQVALFLMRCLFTMLAEDVELLPRESFTALLAKCADDPAKFAPMVEQLWAAMDKGDFAYAVERKVPRFTAASLPTPRQFHWARKRSGNCSRRRRQIGGRWSRRSSARCLSRLWIKTSASGSAPITRRAPMWNAWSSPRS